MSAPAPARDTSSTRATDWLVSRLRAEPMLEAIRRRRLSAHWSSLWAQVAVSAFAVVSITGLWLLFFYEPSTATTVYQGEYTPLQGVEMSRAFESTLTITLEQPGGVLMRQLHNWGASVMIAALLVQILQTFFSGAFRKPRELSWVLPFVVLFLSMAAGLTGSVLPDDLLSGSSLAVLDGVLKSIPVVGTWLSALVFGGNFPSGAIATFYPLHVLVLPLVIAGALAVLGILGVANRPLRSVRQTADARIRSTPIVAGLVQRFGVGLLAAGVLVAIASIATVNPVWMYGPADPGNASAGSGAVWYLAFLDGAQRLMPPGWEFELLGRTWTLAILVPVGLSTLYLLAALLYPFFEGWLTGDRREHHVLTRARTAPTRTGVGVAGILIYGVLWAAAGSDTIADRFGLGLESVVIALQVALLAGPPVAFLVTRRVCLDLQRKDRDLALHGIETGSIVRLPGGEYAERHRPLPAAQAWRVADPDGYRPLVVRPDAQGRVHVSTRVRGWLTRGYYGERVEMPPEAAIAAGAATDPAEVR